MVDFLGVHFVCVSCWIASGNFEAASRVDARQNAMESIPERSATFGCDPRRSDVLSYIYDE